MSRKQAPKKQDTQPSGSGFVKLLGFAIAAIVVLAAVSSIVGVSPKAKSERKDVSLSEIAAEIQAGKAKSITLVGPKVELLGSDGVTYVAKKESESTLVEQLSIYGVTPTQLSAVLVTIEPGRGSQLIVQLIGSIVLPLMLILFLMWMLTRQVKGSGGMKAFSFGESRARISDPNDNKVTFADVAGAEEAKQELVEVVDFLKNPKKYIDIGAKIPRGVLLAGSPGTGKTLLARAVAGEANVPFFYLSGSDFVEMFVGVGASRVRDLFAQAKKASPAIVFIDEIDAVGRHRGVGVGGGNDEREQTLNQILVEMDGFEQNQAVIVLAATNRADILDEALLRPGRFDRRVMLDLPDKKDRIKLLEIHSKKKKLLDPINFEVIAARTPGFSGADIESLMNEAAIRAARADRTAITQDDIVQSIEKVMLGPERRSHAHTEDERKLVAYHEAGHAVLASVLPGANPVHKVTIVPRGYAGGYTLIVPTDERKLKPSAAYVDELAVSMGGMAAETVVFGDTTPGPSGDLESATKMARNMVARWGMSDAVGPIAVDALTKSAGFGEAGISASPETLRVVDQEIRTLLETAKATAILKVGEYRTLLDDITNRLLEVETIEQDEFNEILRRHNIDPKLSKDAITISEDVHSVTTKA